MPIIPAHTDAHLETVRTLFREYVATVNSGYCRSGFRREVAQLPGEYAPPRGILLLLVDAQGTALGCAALCPFKAHTAELRRLYVRSPHRRQGWGRQLLLAVMDHAHQVGYRQLRLECADTMTEALALCHTLGFQRLPPPSPFFPAGIRLLQRPLSGDPGMLGDSPAPTSLV